MSVLNEVECYGWPQPTNSIVRKGSSISEREANRDTPGSRTSYHPNTVGNPGHRHYCERGGAIELNTEINCLITLLFAPCIYSQSNLSFS